MNRTRGIAAACAMALAAVALPATTSTAATAATSRATGQPTTTTIEGELLVAVAHGPGVEETVVSVRTDDGAVVSLDPADVPDALTSASSGAEVAVTVAVPADVRTELAAEGVGAAALADGSAAEEVAAALESAEVAVPATGATVLSEAAPDVADLVDEEAADLAAGGAVAALAPAAQHEAYVVVISDAAAAGDYTEATARAALTGGAEYWQRETSGAFAGLSVVSVATQATTNVCAQVTSGAGIESLWSWLAATRFAGVPFTDASAKHLVVFLPRGCFDTKQVTWTGMARINRNLASGGQVMLTMGDTHTVAHELGHNFGLGHSDVLRDGVEQSYLGLHSVQGIAMFSDNAMTQSFAPPSLDVAYDFYLDTLSDGGLTLGLPGTTAVLSSVSSDAGLRGVLLKDSAGRTYLVEYRDGAGKDAGAFYALPGAVFEGIDPSPGVRVYQADSRFGLRLLTLGSWNNGRWSSTLKAGQSIATRDGSLTVNVAAIGGGTATVQISGQMASSTALQVASARHGKKTRVSVTVAAPLAPTGAVDLYDGAKKVASAAVGANGRATLYLPAGTRAGSHVIKAVYAGSATLTGSSAARQVSVAKARVTAKVVKTKNLKRGKKATLAIRLAGTSATKPAGKVTIKVGSRTVSKAVKVTKVKGRYTAVVKTKALPAGKVRVVYTPTKTAGKNLAKTTVTTSKRVR